MKIQDIGFLSLLVILILFKKSRLSIAVALVCLLLAMPLFAFWIFFTAERLTWYGAAYFLLAIIQIVYAYRH